MHNLLFRNFTMSPWKHSMHNCKVHPSIWKSSITLNRLSIVSTNLWRNYFQFIWLQYCIFKNPYLITCSNDCVFPRCSLIAFESFFSGRYSSGSDRFVALKVVHTREGSTWPGKYPLLCTLLNNKSHLSFDQWTWIRTVDWSLFRMENTRGKNKDDLRYASINILS